MKWAIDAIKIREKAAKLHSNGTSWALAAIRWQRTWSALDRRTKLRWKASMRRYRLARVCLQRIGSPVTPNSVVPSAVVILSHVPSVR